jgi:hypothetical protein
VSPRGSQFVELELLSGKQEINTFGSLGVAPVHYCIVHNSSVMKLCVWFD